MERTYNQIKIKTKVSYGGFDAKQSFYAHSYSITIKNHSLYSFQLMRRKWVISDGLGMQRVVEGDGIVGEQPIIHPGKSYKYSSWCPMPSTVGFMKGLYYCNDLDLNEQFIIHVPLMTMIASERMN